MAQKGAGGNSGAVTKKGGDGARGSTGTGRGGGKTGSGSTGARTKQKGEKSQAGGNADADTEIAARHTGAYRDVNLG